MKPRKDEACEVIIAYIVVTLIKSRIREEYFVHRLVLLSFFLRVKRSLCAMKLPDTLGRSRSSLQAWPYNAECAGLGSAIKQVPVFENLPTLVASGPYVVRLYE